MYEETISILLPVFNCELYVRESLESILQNTYTNFELIIINDGSKDSTLDIIKEFNDERIFLFNKINSGLIDTLNYGLKKCSYPIVMRMDGDDVIEENKIQKQLDYFIKSRSILTGTNGYLINSEGNNRGFIDLPTEHNQIIKSMLNISPSFIHPSVMYYKEAVQKVGGYDPNFKHAEDFDLFLKLSSFGKLSNLNERLIYLRKHGENISQLNAQEQIKNTIISKEIYRLNSTQTVKKFDYESCNIKVEKNTLKKVYIKIHTSIVKMDNLSSSNFTIKLFVFKVFRRILKKLI
jgi:glycosyltransferase involved in cell wall biosynthesis